MSREPLLSLSVVMALGGLSACGAAADAIAPGDGTPADPIATRLAALPPAPVPWESPVARLSDADFEGICPYLAQNAGLSQPEVTCPDGTVVTPYAYHCDPSTSGPGARSMPCAVTFGEVLACYLALREHPCDASTTGQELPECDPFEDCGLDVPRSGS